MKYYYIASLIFCKIEVVYATDHNNFYLFFLDFIGGHATTIYVYHKEDSPHLQMITYPFPTVCPLYLTLMIFHDTKSAGCSQRRLKWEAKFKRALIGASLSASANFGQNLLFYSNLSLFHNYTINKLFTFSLSIQLNIHIFLRMNSRKPLLSKEPLHFVPSEH